MSEPTRRVHCTNHCSACGRHFHSLAAYDAHRTGSFRDVGPDFGRRCAAPVECIDTRGRERLVAVSEDGICTMYSEPQEGVMVWTLRESQLRGRTIGIGRRLAGR